ncbi:MAG: trans-aconitate 2-methyltransferase [Alphaproteobacteria bacterium]|nr:trans-aconitate 2-methyltransferase [Alphaproteobacteria bacterium]
MCIVIGRSESSIVTGTRTPTALRAHEGLPDKRPPGVERLSWNPTQYLKFGDLRLRPAIDLLSRVSIESPKHIIDLGCGTGMVSAVLRERWPDARIVGVDDSPEMLAKAREQISGVEWIEADVESWAPDEPPDLIVSNAVLHWLDRHAELIPRLLSTLRAGGVLAIQMPKNFAAPSHTCITHAVNSRPWRELLEPLTRPDPVASPAQYHALLSSSAVAVDVWEIEYYQVLEGNSPVVEWTSGTILRPLLNALQDTERTEFLRIYERCIEGAYPQGPGGTTLFPFKRLFLVAQV